MKRSEFIMVVPGYAVILIETLSLIYDAQIGKYNLEGEIVEVFS